MSRAERIVFALHALGEARQAATLPDGADAVAAPGQDLVRVALVADVPDQAVTRRVKDVMQGDRQFDDTEASPKVAAGLGYGIDEIVSQLIGNLLQPVRFELPQILGGADLIE